MHNTLFHALGHSQAAQATRTINHCEFGFWLGELQAVLQLKVWTLHIGAPQTGIWVSCSKRHGTWTTHGIHQEPVLNLWLMLRIRRFADDDLEHSLPWGICVIFNPLTTGGWITIDSKWTWCNDSDYLADLLKPRDPLGTTRSHWHLVTLARFI